MTPSPNNAVTQLAARSKLAFAKVRAWLEVSKSRRVWAIAVAVVMILGTAGAIGGTVYNNHATAVAAETAAEKAEAAEEVRIKALRTAELKLATDAALATATEGAVFAAASLDYADSAEAAKLADAIVTLETLVRSRDRTVDELDTLANRVKRLMTAIGERPLPFDWALDCTDAAYAHHSFPTFREVWSATVPLTRCVAGARSGDFATDTQNAAVAAGAVSGPERLGVLYAICAELGFSAYGTLERYSEGQAKEVAGALTICPDHSLAGAVQLRIDATNRVTQGLANGTIFNGGPKRVGVDVQPGTYATEGLLDGCYWERTNSSGEVIDNNFIGSALRAQVTISATDYSFSSSNCGQWVKQ